MMMMSNGVCGALIVLMGATAAVACGSSSSAGAGAAGNAGTSSGAGTPSSAGTSSSAGSVGVAGTSGSSAGAGAGGAAGLGGSGNPAAGGTNSAGSGPAGAGGSAGNSGGSGGYTYWPNPDSHTNSDAWLRDNHDKITQLKPKVLVVDVQRTGRPILDVANAAIKDAAEGSRYHGYSNTSAPVFLNYQIDKVVDLRDPTATYPSFWPPEPFDLGALFSKEFAPHWGYKDPADSHDLALCEIFERGLVNEIWIAAEAGVRNVYENQSYVQIYDAQLKPTGKFSNCTNGCFSDPNKHVTCKVSVRIQELNKDRGSGCFTHAQGHAIENERNRIPYLGSNATRFFYADLKSKSGLGYNTLYDMSCAGNADSTIFAKNGCLTFPTPGHLVFDPKDAAQPKVDFSGFGQGCGDVHHPANIDWSTNLQALTACEGYAMAEGTGGQDKTTTYTTSISNNLFKAFDDDCGGRWQLYMRQSMPGLNNTAKGTDGQPMKNWWVFWYY